MSEKITSGGPLPELDLPLAGGGEVHLGGGKDNRRDGWQMIVVYRGLHCPICKKYPSFRATGNGQPGRIRKPR